MLEQPGLHVTQKIQVSKDGHMWFNSNIQDIRENSIYIAIPYAREQPLVLYKGERVMVRFSMDDSSYMFESTVTGEATSNIKMFRLSYPKEFTRVQQRSHVRLPVILDVQYYIPESSPADKKKPPEFKKATAVDISGGGMKLRVREKVNENTLVRLKFTLPFKNKPEQMELNARVMRCIKADPNREVYHLGLKFEDLVYREEDIIVRFVFEKMAQQKRLL